MIGQNKSYSTKNVKLPGCWGGFQCLKLHYCVEVGTNQKSAAVFVGQKNP